MQPPDLFLVDLAHAGLGQLRGEREVLRQPEARHTSLEKRAQFRGRSLLARPQHHQHERALFPARIGNADHGGFEHCRVQGDLVLEVHRRHPLPAGLDHVLGTVGDLHIAARVDGAHVTGAQPAVIGEGIGRCTLVVATGDPRPAQLQLANGVAVFRTRIALFVHQTHLHARHRAAALGAPHGLVLGRGVARRNRHTAHGACFGHAPALQHGHAPALAHAADQRGRHGRAAGDDRAEAGHIHGILEIRLQQIVRQRGHQRGDGGARLPHHRADVCGLEIRPGHDEIRTREPCRKRQPPGIGMEHRGQQQDAVVLSDTEGVAPERGQGVQEDAAVAVDDAFGITRGAGGVADHRGIALLQFGPRESARVRGEQRLVIRYAHRGRQFHRALAHQDHVLQARHQLQVRR